MKLDLNFEAEPLQFEAASSRGGRCSCPSCSGNAAHEHETSFEAEAEWESPEGFADFEGGFEDMENDFEAVGLEDLEGEFEIDPKAPCAEMTALECQFEAYAADIKKTKPPEGLWADRYVDDPYTERMIQLAEYDINAHTAAQKAKHREGLEQLLKFIDDRRSQINASPDGIRVVISGCASNKSGNTAHNSELACKRARCVERYFLDSYQIADLRDKIHYETSNERFKQVESAHDNRREDGDRRSVLVHILSPGKIIRPVDPKLRWSKEFSIRNCSFKTENLGGILAREVMERGSAALPDSIREALSHIPGGETLVEKAIDEFRSLLKEAVKKLPVFLGRAVSGIVGAIDRIPLEFIQDTGVFEIIDRSKEDKPDPRELVLSYSGIGFRIIIPELPVPDMFKSKAKAWLKQLLKRLRVGDRHADVIDKIPGVTAPNFDSTTPGKPTNFETTQPIRLQDFEGNAQALKGFEIGKIKLAFEAWKFKHLGAPDQVKIIYKGGSPQGWVPVEIGNGLGFEVIAPTKGDLKNCHCQCEPSQAAGVRSLVGRRVKMARQPVPKPKWSARLPAAKPAWTARRPVSFQAAPRRPT